MNQKYEIIFFSLAMLFLVSMPDGALAEHDGTFHPELYCVSSQSLNLIQGGSRFDCEDPDKLPVPSIVAGHNGFILSLAGFELKDWSKVYVFYSDCTTLPPCNFVYEFSLSEIEHVTNFRIEKQIANNQLQSAEAYEVLVYNHPDQAEEEDGAGWSNGEVFTVYNAPPAAVSPAVVSSDYCAVSPVGLVTLRWSYSDGDNDAQTQFQIQIDNDFNFDSPEVDVINTSPGTPNQYSPEVKTSAGEDSLLYGATYYWRVRVWQEYPGAGGIGFDPSVDPDNPAWISGASFATIAHAKPRASFSHTGTSPAISFTGTSTCYDADATCNAYLWNFGDGSTSTQKNWTHNYASPDTYTVTLQVTDGDNLMCTAQEVIPALNMRGSGQIQWKETSPLENWGLPAQCLPPGATGCADPAVSLSCCVGGCILVPYCPECGYCSP